MSDILRRIITRFEAQPGNVRAVLGGVSSGYSQAAGSARTLAREQSYLNNQLRAFGTTMRYAIAGTAIFGAAGTISTLSQIQTQLGQISALSGLAGVKGPRGESVALVGKSLDDMSQQVRAASINVVQPISSINESILNLLSTSQGLKQNEIVPIIEELSKGATLAQTPVENLTQAAASMNIAFGQTPSLENFRKFSREWFTLIGLAPGARAAAPQLVTQLGPLASIAKLGRMNQEQMMTLVLGATRFGGNPSTSMRGLQYLIQGIAAPTGQQGKALAEIGITPGYVQREGGWKALMKMLQYVGKTNTVSGAQATQLSNISEEDLQDMSDTGKLPPAMASGAGMAWLRRATSRVHAQRTAIILASQLQRHGDVASLMEDYNMIADKTGDQTVAYVKGWQNFLDRAKLPQAAIALSTLGQDVATAFEPILNLGATGLTGISKLATKHKDLTSGLAIGGGLAALLYGGWRMFGSVGRRGIPAVALAQGMTGGEGAWKGMPGESPQHPAYVWVMGTGLQFGAGKTPPIIAGPGGEAPAGGGAATRAGRFRGLARGALKYSIIGAAAYYGAQAAEPFLDQYLPHWGKDPYKELAKKPNMQTLGQKDQGTYYYNYKRKKFEFSPKAFGGEFDVSEKYVAKRLGVTMAALDAVTKGKPLKVQGKAQIEVNINEKRADGTTVKTKKVSVPVELYGGFNDFPLKAPTSRGQSKTTRG